MISAGIGTNIIFGDNGLIQYSAGVLITVESMNPELGGDDTITAGSGNNTIIGGLGNDTISAGRGTNIIFGDSGSIQYSAGVLSTVESMNPELGGDDTITAGSGTNTIIGGLGNDMISAGIGTNIIFGDNGFIQYTAGVLSMVESMNPSWVAMTRSRQERYQYDHRRIGQ